MHICAVYAHVHMCSSVYVEALRSMLGFFLETESLIKFSITIQIA